MQSKRCLYILDKKAVKQEAGVKNKTQISLSHKMDVYALNDWTQLTSAKQKTNKQFYIKPCVCILLLSPSTTKKQQQQQQQDEAEEHCIIW